MVERKMSRFCKPTGSSGACISLSDIFEGCAVPHAPSVFLGHVQKVWFYRYEASSLHCNLPGRILSTLWLSGLLFSVDDLPQVSPTLVTAREAGVRPKPLQSRILLSNAEFGYSSPRTEGVLSLMESSFSQPSPVAASSVRTVVTEAH